MTSSLTFTNFKGIFVLFGNEVMKKRPTLSYDLRLTTREEAKYGSEPIGHYICISVDFLTGDSIVFDATGQQISKFTSPYFHLDTLTESIQCVSDVINYLSKRRLCSIKLKKAPLSRNQSPMSNDCGVLVRVLPR